MKRSLGVSALARAGTLALLAAVAAGCGGTSAPASSAAAPTSSSPAVKPAGSAAASGAASAKPASSASASAKPAGSAAAPADWQQTVEAAKKEGTVAVFGPDGNDMRDVLTQPFEREFPGIKVEFVGDPGPGIPPRINAERGAGKFLWDVIVTGTSTGLTALVPAKVLDPLEPALILPDVKDPNTWRGGAMEFLDPNKSLLVMTPFQRGTLFINPKLAKAEDFKSYRDLLDAKWKGKIVLDDPRKSGPGQATFTFFYLHPELGPNFIKQLGQQQMTVIKDFSQEVDMVGQGRMPVLLGGADFIVVARSRQGVPIEVVDPRGIKEGSDVSPANGSVGIVNNRPHPNAAKVYLNWLLSKEEQTAFAKVNGYVSARLDVPTDHVPAWRVPQPGAIKSYDANAIAVREKVLAAAEEALGKS